MCSRWCNNFWVKFCPTNNFLLVKNGGYSQKILRSSSFLALFEPGISRWDKCNPIFLLVSYNQWWLSWNWFDLCDFVMQLVCHIWASYMGTWQMKRKKELKRKFLLWTRALPTSASPWVAQHCTELTSQIELKNLGRRFLSATFESTN